MTHGIRLDKGVTQDTAKPMQDGTDIRRVYAIGDVHGRLDLLDKMIENIRKDLTTTPSDQCMTVTLGDYVDRGPDSRGVLDRLAGNPFPTRYIPLKGNHEELLHAFLQDPTIGRQWRSLGGFETLHSYGVPVTQLMMGSKFESASEELRNAIPDQHYRFLASLKTSATWAGYFLCHAGVRPGVALTDQREDDLLWIRDEFLNSKQDLARSSSTATRRWINLNVAPIASISTPGPTPPAG